MIKVGLCGFTIAMTTYSSHYPVVEVQQTFYQPPRNPTMERWRRTMPDGFEFVIKAWQLITHEATSPTYRRLREPLDAEARATAGAFRPSAIVRDALARTLDAARLLDASAVLFQCPAKFRPTSENVERMRAFFSTVANPSRPRGVRYLWEPRGPAWTEEIELGRSLARELDLTYVVDPFVDPPDRRRDRPAYFRLHGIGGAYHVYTDDELARLVDLTPRDAYVMFNNVPRASDAQRFLRLLDQRR